MSIPDYLPPFSGFGAKRRISESNSHQKANHLITRNCFSDRGAPIGSKLDLHISSFVSLAPPRATRCPQAAHNLATWREMRPPQPAPSR